MLASLYFFGFTLPPSLNSEIRGCARLWSGVKKWYFWDGVARVWTPNLDPIRRGRSIHSTTPHLAFFQGLDMAIFRAKICSTWPEMVPVVPPARYFDALICFHRCTGPWTTKNWKKVEKIAKNQFSRPNLLGLHSAKKQYNDRRDFRRTLGLKREVVLTDF